MVTSYLLFTGNGPGRCKQTADKKRPRRHIFLKVSREGYTGTAHPACCVTMTLGPYVSAVSTLTHSFRQGIPECTNTCNSERYLPSAHCTFPNNERRMLLVS